MGRNNIAFIIIGIIVLAVGIALRSFVGRRRFYRKNQAGLQGFSNYRNSLLTPFFERILTFIAGLLIILGVSFLGAAAFVSK